MTHRARRRFATCLLAAFAFIVPALAGPADRMPMMRAQPSAGLRIDVRNPRGPLLDWVIEVPLDISRLRSSGGRPGPSAIEVWELYGAGREIARRPSQFDPEPQGSSHGMLSWILDGLTPPGATRHFEVRVGSQAPGAASSGVSVSRMDGELRVANSSYEVGFGTGAAIRQVTFRKSGRAVLLQMDDAVFPGAQQGNRGPAWRLSNDQQPDVVVSGPVRTVVEVNARFKQTERNRESIRILYRYTFFATMPLINVEVTLPAQPVPAPVPKLSILKFIFAEASSFPRWLTGSVKPSRPLSGSGRHIPFAADEGTPPWGALVSDGEAFGIIGGQPGAIYDGKGSASITGVSLARWSGGAWAGEPRTWRAYLYLGEPGADGDAVRAMAQAANGSVVTMRDATLDAATTQTESEARAVLARASQGRSGPVQTAARVLAMTAQMIGRAAQERSASGRDTAAGSLLASWAKEISGEAGQVLAGRQLPPPMPLLIRQPPFVAAANGWAGWLFRVSNDWSDLEAIAHYGTGHEFIRPAAGPRKMWEIRFRDSVSGRLFSLTSTASAEVALTEERPSSGVLRLRWVWKNIPVQGEGIAASVRLIVTLVQADPLARWRIEVDDRNNRFAVYDVAFPIIGGIGKPRGADGTDFVVFPQKSGLLWSNPGGSPPFDEVYPGPVTMQLVPYWYERSGLYLATYDGEAYLKRFRVQPAPDGSFEFRVVNRLPHGRPGGGFVLPYDGIVGVFQGDWYDAAKMYRQWALKQAWVPRAPSYANPSIPRWFKEVSVTFRPDGDPKDVLSSMETLHRRFAMPAIVNWYKWASGDALYDNSPDLTARPGFGEAVAKLQSDGMYVVPFMPLFMWDTRAQSWSAERGETAAVREENGSVRLKHYGKLPLAAMSPSSPLWQRKILATLSELLKADIQGVYLDLAGTPVSAPPDGGREYAQQVRALLTLIRDAGRKRNPNFIILAEVGPEPYLNVVDSYLLYEGVQEDLRPVNIPMFQAIYGEYIRPYGAKSIGLRPEPVEALLAAQAFTFGSRIGRVFSAKVLAEKPAFADYLIRLAQYRQMALPYLGYGEMLRPLRITPLSPPLSKLQQAGLAIQTSSWRAPDRSVGIFFTNATTKGTPISFRVRIDPREYGLPSDGSYVLYELSPEGKRKVATLSGPVDWQGELPSMGTLALVIQPH